MAQDNRPFCHFCLKEGRENPKIGFLWYDLDGTGRKPVCGEHHDIARNNTRKAMEAMVKETTGTIDAVDGEKRDQKCK